VPQQSTGGHSFDSKFSTTVKVMAEMEKLQELRDQRDREASQKARMEMKGVYLGRFQHGRTSAREETDSEEEDEWRPTQESRSPSEEEWTEVRHSKARKQPHEKSMRDLAEEYQAKAIDEEEAEDYNGELFDRSHRHDHYAT
jgi:glucan-binding YG repeat protein